MNISNATLALAEAVLKQRLRETQESIATLKVNGDEALVKTSEEFAASCKKALKELEEHFAK